jgi:hypothetical protein
MYLPPVWLLPEPFGYRISPVDGQVEMWVILILMHYEQGIVMAYTQLLQHILCDPLHHQAINLGCILLA